MTTKLSAQLTTQLAIRLEEEKLKVIDIIIEMYPELKKNKNDIISNVFEKNGKLNRYIFTKFVIDNKELYIDPYGLILDKKLLFKIFFINDKYYLEDDHIELVNIEKYDKLMKL